MTDLLTELREVNPVPRCDSPPIEDVWRKLDAGPPLPSPSPSRPGIGAATPQPRRLTRMRRGLAPVAGVAVSLAVLIVALVSLRSKPGAPANAGHGTPPAWRTQEGGGPSLSALMPHFAVLRRPPTAAERAAARRFGTGIGTGTRTEYPTYVRQLGTADGVPVYLVAFADFQHGATGRVVGYSPEIDALGGNSYGKSNYLIFPSIQGDESTSGNPQLNGPTFFLGVVPDGVRSVRWEFRCPAGSAGTGCVLPRGRHVVDLPVHGNLVVLPLAHLNPGTSYPAALSVTWYRADGTQSTFEDPNTAIPFDGAPAWPVASGPSATNYVTGNGAPAGEPLSYWQARYSVLRRPQDRLSRAAITQGQAAVGVPIVPSLTRALLNDDHALVLVALSAVNPSAGTAHRRYIAQAAVAALTPNAIQANPPSSRLQTGPSLPSFVFTSDLTGLWFSVVPDGVTTVQWRVVCHVACAGRSTETLTLHAHDNLVSTSIRLPQSGESPQVTQVSWYVRGRTAPLRAR